MDEQLEQPREGTTTNDVVASKQSDGERRIAEYLYSDPLLSLIGFFDAGYKRRKPTVDEPSKRVALHDGRAFETVPTLKYGFPNTEDQDWLHGFERMMLDRMQRRADYTDDGALVRRPHFQLPITYHLREHIRVAGKVECASTVRSAREWVKRMTATTIEGAITYGAKNKSTIEGATHLFRQATLIGEKLPDGTVADQVHVWPESWFLSRLAYLQTQLLDLTLYQELGRFAYAKQLLPVLYNAFYATSGKPWRKSYRDICTTFGLTFFPKPARRAQQLDPGHRQLLKHGVIKSWAWQHGATDAVLTFVPGPKYFDDLAARGDRRAQANRIAGRVGEPAEQPPQLTGATKPRRRTGNPYDLTADQVGQAEGMATAVVDRIGHQKNQRYFFTLAAKAIKADATQTFFKVLAEVADAHHRGMIHSSPSAYFAAALDKQLTQPTRDLFPATPPRPTTLPTAPPPIATAPQPTPDPEPETTPEERERIRVMLRDSINQLTGKMVATTPTPIVGPTPPNPLTLEGEPDPTPAGARREGSTTPPTSSTSG